MFQSQKKLSLAISGLILLIALPMLTVLYMNSEPAIIDETYGEESTIYLEAARNSILFPGECLRFNWEINGINAVFISQYEKSRGTTGTNATIYCIWSENPTLQVIFQDESIEFYTLEITHLYKTPLVFTLLILAVTAACVLAYHLIGVSAVLIIITTLSFIPMMSINASTELDFQGHIGFLQLASDSGNLQDLPPHFIFHIFTLGLKSIFPFLSLMRATFFIVLFAMVTTVLGLYLLLRILDKRSQNSPYLRLLYGALAFALVWIGPIPYFISNPPLLRSSALLLANTYHSPTMLVMRLFSVLLFVGLLTVPKTLSKRYFLHIIAIISLLFLSAFSKPNYVLVIVPAYLIYMGILYIRHRQIPHTILLLAIAVVLSTVAIVGLQYFAIFDANSTNVVASENSSVVIDWFGLYRIWGITPLSAIVAWLFSLSYPLFVYGLYFNKASRDDFLNLAWIALMGAIAMAVLFVEVPRTSHGNFIWGTRITTLLVFAMSTSFLIRQQKSPLIKNIDWRFILCLGLFLMHFVGYSYITLNFMLR